MTPDQKRKILEAAAKACGLAHVDYSDSDYDGRYGLMLVGENGEHARSWCPIDNLADAASMCAQLDIDTFWRSDKVSCSLRGQVGVWTYPHDGTPEGKEAAWRLAASMVAAKIGGYIE